MKQINIETIFNAAKKYDFETIKKYIDSGGAINICDSKGISIVAYFIEAYLTKEQSVELDNKEELFLVHDEYDYKFWDEYVYNYQITPLRLRRSNILEKINYLFAHNADPNLCEIVDGAAETPLYFTVCVFQDYYFTKYLLEHGADPGIWLFDDSKMFGYEQEPFLMDDLDIAIMNGAKGDKAENIIAIAQLLWEYGLKNWGGFCIDIDPVKGVIGSHSIRVKY